MLASWPRLPVPPLAGDWGYRPITAYAGIVVREGDPRRHAPADLPWLAGGVIITPGWAPPTPTAIVQPRAFTTAILRAAQGHGAELRQDRVTGTVRRAPGQTVSGIEVDGDIIQADAVVVALGPWSLIVAHWQGCPPCTAREEPQPDLRHRHGSPGRRALSRTS